MLDGLLCYSIHKLIIKNWFSFSLDSNIHTSPNKMEYRPHSHSRSCCLKDQLKQLIYNYEGHFLSTETARILSVYAFIARIYLIHIILSFNTIPIVFYLLCSYFLPIRVIIYAGYFCNTIIFLSIIDEIQKLIHNLRCECPDEQPIA